MPKISADGCAIHVEVEGLEHAPVLMLSNSLGTNLHMWDDQVAPFTKHFRLVRYDRRGHGQSDVPKGPYSMERLGRDVLAILDGLNIERTNWCGLSMGGMVGMWLGANAPDRINKLILSNTSSYMPDNSVWDARIKTAREQGLAALVEGTFDRWFTKPFRERAPQAVEPIQANVRCHRGRRLCRLRRGDPRHGAPAAARQNYCPHIGHRRPARSRHDAGSRRVLAEHIPGASSSSLRRRILPTSSSRRSTPKRCWDFCSVIRPSNLISRFCSASLRAALRPGNVRLLYPR